MEKGKDRSMQKRRGDERQGIGLGVRLDGLVAPPVSSALAARRMKVVRLSPLMRLALPPLLISSSQRKAIGFSYPRGAEGKLMAVSLLVLTALLSTALSYALGLLAYPLAFWLTGGTAVLMAYSCLTDGVAFVKEMCAGCRLLPIIEEHEAMHLAGVSSEREVWSEARKVYSYEGLSLGDDPRICSFCPIAEHLRDRDN